MDPSPKPSNAPNQAQCCMLVLCGIPGSGKSTIAAALAAAAETSGTLATVVDFDTPPAASAEEEMEISSHNLEDFNPEKWKRDRAACLEAVFQALDNDSSTGTSDTDSSKAKKHLVIIDDTMHYRSMRAECWRIARATGAAYLYSHIKCPVEIALTRNNHRRRGQRVPEDVLRRTAAIFEPPEENNHCSYDSNAYRVMLDTGNTLLLDGEALWSRVYAVWGSPAPAPFDEEAEEARVSEARKATVESLLHHIDVQTRKYLTKVLSSSQHMIDKMKVAENLNKKRRQVLENFRFELLKNESDTYSIRAGEIIEEFEKYCRDYLAS